MSSDSQHVSEDERTCLKGGGEVGLLLVLQRGNGEGSWGHDFKMVTCTSIVTLIRRGLGFVRRNRILNTGKKEGFPKVYLLK